MKVLFIAPLFGRENKIGSVRTTKIAKYLSQMGHEIDVFCREPRSNVFDPILLKEESCVQKIVRAGNSRPYKTFYECLSGKKHIAPARASNERYTQGKGKNHARMVQCFQKALYQKMVSIEDADMRRQLLKAIVKQGDQYDIVFSTYGPFCSHYVAQKIKKRNIAKYWVADFRDAVQGRTSKRLFSRLRARKYEAMTIQNADYITAVSTDILHDMNVSSHCGAVPNGFDRTDISAEAIHPFEKFTFLYAGSMLNGGRDLSAFFKALRELGDEKSIDINHVSFLYMGMDFAVISAQAQKWGVDNILRNGGYVSREESIRLQKAAHVLLMASSNTAGGTGVITGKFYEYLMMGKPIVCVMGGEIPNSKLKEMITEAKIGVCYEEALKAQDHEALKAYILLQYKSFTERGAVSHCPNGDYINQFDYQRISKAFDGIFNGFGKRSISQDD